MLSSGSILLFSPVFLPLICLKAGTKLEWAMDGLRRCCGTWLPPCALEEELPLVQEIHLLRFHLAQVISWNDAPTCKRLLERDVLLKVSSNVSSELIFIGGLLSMPSRLEPGLEANNTKWRSYSAPNIEYVLFSGSISIRAENTGHWPLALSTPGNEGRSCAIEIDDCYLSNKLSSTSDL